MKKREFLNLINGWIMDDLVGNPDLLLRELPPRLVRDLDRTFHAPAEAVRLRQFHRYVSPRILVTVLLQRLNHIACIITSANSIHHTITQKKKKTLVLLDGSPNRKNRQSLTHVFLIHEL